MGLVLSITGCGDNKEKDNQVITETSANRYLIDIKEVVGTGKVEPENEIISLASATGGIVREIYFGNGDSIRKGEPLVRLDDEPELIKVSQLKSQYNSISSQVEIDKLTLDESTVKLSNSKKLLESVRRLESKGAEARQVLDDLETEVTTLSLAVEKNRATVKLTESRLREVYEQLRYAEAEASKKILRSPYDGILLEMHIRKGEAVNQYEKYAEIAPPGPLTVKAEVDELFAERIKTGIDAEIRYIGSDSVLATGKVVFVSPYLKKKSLFTQKANDQEDRLVREIKIKLEQGSKIILNSKVETIVKL